MPRAIPLPAGLPHFELQARLDDITYTLEFRWNVRAAAWFLNILDADGAALYRAGARVVVDFPLALHGERAQLDGDGKVIVAGAPPGMLVVLDTTGRHTDPDFDAMGTTAQLLYYTAAEMAG